MYSIGRGKEGRKYIMKCSGWRGKILEVCKISEFAGRPLHPVIQAVNPCRKVLSLLLTQKRREEDGAGQRVLSHWEGDVARGPREGPSLAPSPLCQLLPPNTYG